MNVFEQAGEVRTLELGDGGFVALHPPVPEVEVNCAGGALDAAPQRPAVLGDDALQVGPRGLVPQPAAVVGGDELVELIGGQAALGPDVAEFEARIVVSGVLVVDDPDPVAVFDEVLRQQVVVARDGGLIDGPQRVPDPAERVGVLQVVRRDLEAIVQHGFQVWRLAFEHVEAAAKPRPGMQCPASRGHLRQHPRPLKIVVAQRLSVEVAQQQDAEIGAVVDHRCTDACALGGDGVVVLRVAVDGQEVGGGVGAARDVDAVRRGDLDVAIGQPAGEVLAVAAADRSGPESRRAAR